MRKTIIICNHCHNVIADEEGDMITVENGKTKKYGVTLALTTRGQRIHVANNTQLRVSLDLYVIGEDGSDTGPADFHKECLEFLVQQRLKRWYEHA